MRNKRTDISDNNKVEKKKYTNVSITQYVAKAFLWGTLSRVVMAVIQFISVPLLLSNFGKSDFGIIVLATSINAYIQLLDLGVSSGAVKYFSEWIEKNNYKLLDSVARTSISFYVIIGFINSFFLVMMAFFGLSMFSIEPDQVPIMKNMFFILAAFSIANWTSSVFSQLLIANEQTYVVEQVNIFRHSLGFIVLMVTILFNWKIITYFFAFILVNSLVIITFFFLAKKNMLIESIIPSNDWKNFGEVFKYSLAIISMGLFQLSAIKLRPVILGIFSNEGSQILADFRVMETITLFVIYIGGMFTSIFLPKTTKLLLANNKEKIENFTYNATKYTTTVVVCLSVPIILCSNELIILYVGSEYIRLSFWLNLWVLFILFGLHNSPVASLVLASGKTTMLVYSSAIACIVSLIVNAILTAEFSVGSAIIGFIVYTVIQMSFYYFYYNNRVLGLNSIKVFKSFIETTSLGLFSGTIIWYLGINFNNLIFQIIVKTIMCLILYGSLLFIFRIILYNDLKIYFKNAN